MSVKAISDSYNCGTGFISQKRGILDSTRKSRTPKLLS